MIGLFAKGPAGDQFAYLALTVLMAYGLAFIADSEAVCSRLRQPGALLADERLYLPGVQA